MKSSELFTAITKQTGLYNIQSINNIPSIIQYGLLSNEKTRKMEHTSIAMEEVQQKRDTVYIPNGLQLHQYVNVYFDPKNPMLSARRSENENICILKIDRCILDLKDTIVTDRNASSNYAGFYSPEVGLHKIDFKTVYATYWTDDDYYEYLRKKSVKCAEVLVPHKIPYIYITCAAVVNERAKEKMELVGFDKDIVIEPRLFF